MHGCMDAHLCFREAGNLKSHIENVLFPCFLGKTLVKFCIGNHLVIHIPV